MGELGLRAISAFGYVALIAVAWALSRDRGGIAWRTVGWGVGLQALLAIVLLVSPIGAGFFVGASLLVQGLIEYTGAGVAFLFGELNTGDPMDDLSRDPSIVCHEYCHMVVDRQGATFGDAELETADLALDRAIARQEHDRDVFTAGAP